MGHVGQAIEHLPVMVPVKSIRLEGTLSIPTAASGVVVFAHGSGSSRHSPRNRYVADILNEAGLATLLIDLLNADEQEVDLQTGQLRFDIAFLANRLIAIAQWLRDQPQAAGLKLGFFGASTGAGAALVAAAELPLLTRAVVSRGGRIDLAGPALERVTAPTLAIVGGDDVQVLELNRRALERVRAAKSLEVIPGAGHLFEEPGALGKVAKLARSWFVGAISRAPADGEWQLP
jgi:putative phosphoribosyl transferase